MQVFMCVQEPNHSVAGEKGIVYASASIPADSKVTLDLSLLSVGRWRNIYEVPSIYGLA